MSDLNAPWLRLRSPFGGGDRQQVADARQYEYECGILGAVRKCQAMHRACYWSISGVGRRRGPDRHCIALHNNQHEHERIKKGCWPLAWHLFIFVTASFVCFTRDIAAGESYGVQSQTSWRQKANLPFLAKSGAESPSNYSVRMWPRPSVIRLIGLGVVECGVWEHRRLSELFWKRTRRVEKCAGGW